MDDITFQVESYGSRPYEEGHSLFWEDSCFSFLYPVANRTALEAAYESFHHEVDDMMFRVAAYASCLHGVANKKL